MHSRICAKRIRLPCSKVAAPKWWSYGRPCNTTSIMQRGKLIQRCKFVFKISSENTNLIILFEKVPNSAEAMSNITVDVLKLAKGNVYEVHERFIRTFESKWRQDENIILILSAIVLFTPSRPRTVHSDVLKLEQVRRWRPCNCDFFISICCLPEFILLFVAPIFGKYLSGLWGKVNVSEIDTENQRSAAAERGYHWRLFGRESKAGWTIVAWNIWFEKSLGMYATKFDYDRNNF